MSVADTAEYQQEQLAKELNKLRKDMDGTCKRDLYVSGFLDALDAVAARMDIKTRKVYQA